MATVLGSQLPTAEDVKLQTEEAYTIKDSGSFKDFVGAFKEENLTINAFSFFEEEEDFPIEQGYNPLQDPNLEGLDSLIDHFLLSKSSAETQAILNKLKERKEYNADSPYGHMGRALGFFLDPSSAVLLTKVGRTALGLGTALTTEEIIKQNIDPLRDDNILPWTVGLGFGLPALINGFRTPIPPNVTNKIKNYDISFHSPQSKKYTQIDYEDGKFINPKEMSGGAAGSPDAKILTPKAELEGEQFVKSNLGIFGENGPWTPVFRLMKSKSLTAVKMIGDILDTPLLKLKNTEQYGFKASEPSLEINLKMREAPVVQAQQEIKDLYLTYLKNTKQSVPTSEIGINLKNRMNSNGLSISQFNAEVTKARLNNFEHAIPEVAEAARISEKLVYGPLGKELDELGLFLEPTIREKNFWQGIYNTMKSAKENVKTFTSKIDGKSVTWNIGQVEKQIAKLDTRINDLKKYGGLRKNYVNVIYNKNTIDKNKPLFIQIIKEDFINKGLTITNKQLQKLADDLSNHFPFIRYEQTLADEAERFALQRPRYARSTRARILNLSSETLTKLVNNNFILDDIMSLMKTYYRQVTPDILLTRKFGDPNGLGYKFTNEADSILSPGIKNIIEDYNSLILKAKNKKEATNLRKELKNVIKDMEASIELLRGTYGLPADPTKWYSIGMRTMKNYNALTMLTGFFAAIPDVARIVMTSGLQRGFKSQIENFAKKLELTKLAKAEAQRFGEAVDMITGQRAMIFSDIGDMFGVYSKVEAGMSKVANLNFMYVNLMSRWTEFIKGAASLTIGTRIIEDSKLWAAGKLSNKWKTKLAASGIDEGLARRIARQAELHSEKTQYNYLPNTAKWDDEIAEQAFGAALNKDINITIVTPSKGDTPLWMSTELGSTIAQFKKFVMGATQRMLLRGMQEKDMDFLFGSILLMGSGMIIDKVYNEFRFNKDYSKISTTDKLLNAFDRSGLGGIYVDVNRAIETLTDNRIGIRPMLGAKKPYGSNMKNKLGTVLGPSASQIGNIFDIMYDVGKNEYNHYTARNVRRLIPFQNVWYLDWLFDDIEKGLR